jgi:hypothetical protein
VSIPARITFTKRATLRAIIVENFSLSVSSLVVS